MSKGSALTKAAFAGAAAITAGVALYLGSRDANTQDPDMPKKSIFVWPIPFEFLNGIGDSLLEHRKGTGDPHKGVDLLADAGTIVRSASAGKVLRVRGSASRSTPSEAQNKRSKSERAGLFVDVESPDGRVFRYLHLGQASVVEGQRIQPGSEIGTVAATGSSGVLRSPPHLHFEVRQSDWDRAQSPPDYGAPINPLAVLPLRISEKRRA